jgi:hypothetical protein
MPKASRKAAPASIGSPAASGYHNPKCLMKHQISLLIRGLRGGSMAETNCAKRRRVGFADARRSSDILPGRQAQAYVLEGYRFVVDIDLAISEPRGKNLLPVLSTFR